MRRTKWTITFNAFNQTDLKCVSNLPKMDRQETAKIWTYIKCISNASIFTKQRIKCVGIIQGLSRCVYGSACNVLTRFARNIQLWVTKSQYAQRLEYSECFINTMRAVSKSKNISYYEELFICMKFIFKIVYFIVANFISLIIISVNGTLLTLVDTF